MAYRPQLLRSGSLTELSEDVRRELQRLAEDLEYARDALRVVQLNTSPTRPRVGDLVYADGTNWNPSVGKGLYYFDGTNWIRVAAGGDEWVDVDFPIIVRTTGTGIPTLQTLQGNITAPQWAVNDFHVCEGQELIHGWDEGTAVKWHLHMITNSNDATDRYVNWEVEYAWANVNGVLSSATTITSGDFKIPASTTAKTHFIVPIADTTFPGGRIGGHVYARLKRIAASGTAPSANPWCSMLQMHIQVNTMGSDIYNDKSQIGSYTTATKVGALRLTGHAPTVTKT